MTGLAQKLLALDDALTSARFPHAFGGAIALAYCTEEPRGTRDLDVNVFARRSRAADVLRALPREVSVDDNAIRVARHEGQVRVWWEDTPIDVFLDVHRFHRRVAEEVRTVPFSGREIPVLGCTALVVFKALFDRTRDWADIEAVVDAGAADLDEATAWITQVLGADHAITRRLASLDQR